MTGNIEFILDKDDLPFGRSGRGRPISDAYIRERVQMLLKDAVDDIAGEVHNVAVSLAPARTGNLKSAIDFEAGDLNVGVLVFREAALFPTRAVVAVNLEKAPYGKFVHDGTGIYGPHKTMIVSQEISEKTGRNKKLAFFSRERWHFVDEVKGQKPQPFMEQAYDIVRKSYAPARVLRLKQEIGNLG